MSRPSCSGRRVATKNECRAVFDLPRTADGDGFFTPPAPSLPGMDFGGGQEQPEPAESKGIDPARKYEKYPLAPVVEVLQKWFAKQKQYVLDNAVSKAFTPSRSKAWVSLDQFTNEMADDLYPALRAYYDGAAK